MQVEILFSDMGYYYGDNGNVTYLEKCLPEASFIYTDNPEVPYFVREKTDLVYLGSLSEDKQQLAISRLLPYRDIIRERIAEDTIFLFTGNSLEILGTHI